ncbi:MAG: hypothetical protein ACD_47C00067G0005 [uncultured bacterium]|nr:MAG: hypothetical protein ACD_47C00067G0005 [uncultured bacterium]
MSPASFLTTCLLIETFMISLFFLSALVSKPVTKPCLEMISSSHDLVSEFKYTPLAISLTVSISSRGEAYPSILAKAGFAIMIFPSFEV